MAILSKVHKQENFKSRNSLKLSFINVWGSHSNFVGCKFFLKSNSPDILSCFMWDKLERLNRL